MKKIIKYILAILAGCIAAVFYASSFLALASSPWVPSRKKDLRRIYKAIDPKPNEKIYDLGSGDGRLLLYLAKKSQARIIGIELSFFYLIISKIKVYLNGLKERVLVRWGDFYREKMHDADKIFFYLTKRASQEIAQKLSQELKEGTKIITYHYPIEGWEHVRVIQNKKTDLPIFIYLFRKNIQKVSFDA